MSRIFAALVLSLLASSSLGIVGCASSRAVHDDRRGVLDRLLAMPPAHHSTQLNERGEVASRESRKTFLTGDNKDRKPAAVLGIQEIKSLSLQWPVSAPAVTSPFGQRKREFHEGVDLRAKSGTVVYAAHAGQVIYAADRIRGYGKMIVLKHSSGLATIYAHTSKLLVHRGEWVHQGSEIALSGNTGHSTGPHLHFEVRSGVAAINPLEVMPPLRHRLLASTR